MAASSKKDIPKTDCFLTHDWGIDEKGRQNHQRVAIINKSLNELGYVTWFDEERMEGEVRKKMVDGINGTRVVIVFVTTRYMDKVNGYGTSENDNSKMEFDYAFDTKTRKNMICVVMDDTMTNPSNWEDILKMTMGGCIFVQMNGDLEDEAYLKQQMKELVHQLTLKGVTPSKAKKHCSKCNVQGEGTFCSNCGARLQQLGDDKKPSPDVKKNTKPIPADVLKKFEEEGFSYVDSLIQQNEDDTLALLAEKSMSLHNDQDDSPVLRAAALGNVNALKVLIKNGAKFDDVNKYNETILHRSASNDRIECVEYISKTYPSLLSSKAKYSSTPILYAAAWGKLNALKSLIENGARFDDVDNIFRETILHRAASNDRVECVKYISKTYPMLRSWEANDGGTPVLYAAAWGTLNAMKATIEAGAKFDEVNKHGNTILHRAAATGRLECVQYISRTYPSLLTQKNKTGYTALHLASYNGEVECIKALIAAGCDFNQKDPSSRSNIDLAILGGHTDCENELKKL